MEVLLGVAISGLVQYSLARVQERKEYRKLLMKCTTEKEIAEIVNRRILEEKRLEVDMKEKHDASRKVHAWQ